MDYIELALASSSPVDPERAVLSAAFVALVGLVIFIIRNKRNLAERLRKDHG